MEKTFNSISVANYLLKKDENLSPLKLIKLVYMCHGWHLGLYGTPLVNEPVEAWRHGPVFQKLYDAVKQFVAVPVIFPIKGGDVAKFTKRQKQLVDEVYDYYKGYKPWPLSDLTHEDGTPWADTWMQSPYGNAIVDSNLIRNHFAAKANHGR